MKKLIVFLLVLRSSLDFFSNIRFGASKLNIPAFWSLVIIAIGVLYLLLHKKVKVCNVMILWLIWLLVLLFSLFISIWINSYNLTILLGSFREWVRLFSIFFTFVLAYNLVQKSEDEKYIHVLFFSLIIPLIVGYYQIYTKSGIYDWQISITRIHGTFAHPNSFGLFLVFFILLTYWKLSITKTLVWYIILLIEIFCLIFTFSFSAFILLLLSGLLITIKHSPKVRLILVISLVIFIIFAINRPEFKIRWERIQLINLKATLIERDVVDSFTWRIVNWMNLLELWKGYPIIGIGLNNIEVMNPWKTLEGVGYAAHNDYIKILTETGILGFILYIFLNIHLLRSFYKNFKISFSSNIKNLSYILFVFFISWQLVSVTDNYITSTAFQLYFWFITGAVYKLNIIKNRE